jgi:hypothetical protein
VTTTEDILELARSIRPYLPELLPQPTAAELDQTLADLLAQADSNPSVPLLIQKHLRSHDTTREWANQFLGNPKFAGTYRQYNPLAGQPSDVSATTFKCPQCDHTWDRPRIGMQPPPCPIHNISLEPVP